MRSEFDGALWLYDGPDPWHFITVPVEISDAISDFTAGPHSGFGSVRVIATIGTTTWDTSLFPDKKLGAFLLPVKAAVREAESLAAGDILTVRIEVASEPK